VLVMKTGISSILICIATTLLPGPWISYLNWIMIPADSEKWWKDLSPIFIFVAFSIVLVSVGTLWPTSLRSFAALPRALNYIPFFECSRVSRCSISSLVSGTGLLSFKFTPKLWTRCSWTSAFSPLSFLQSVVSLFESSLSASCNSFEWTIRPVEITSLNRSWCCYFEKCLLSVRQKTSRLRI
jgi:hypothetical protein